MEVWGRMARGGTGLREAGRGRPGPCSLRLRSMLLALLRAGDVPTAHPAAASGTQQIHSREDSSPTVNQGIAASCGTQPHSLVNCRISNKQDMHQSLMACPDLHVWHKMG